MSDNYCLSVGCIVRKAEETNVIAKVDAMLGIRCNRKT